MHAENSFLAGSEKRLWESEETTVKNKYGARWRRNAWGQLLKERKAALSVRRKGENKKKTMRQHCFFPRTLVENPVNSACQTMAFWLKKKKQSRYYLTGLPVNETYRQACKVILQESIFRLRIEPVWGANTNTDRSRWHTALRIVKVLRCAPQ